jgi:hypothetical protein
MEISVLQSMGSIGTLPPDDDDIKVAFPFGVV